MDRRRRDSTVDVVHPSKGPLEQQVVLPGEIHAWYEARRLTQGSTAI